MRKSELIESNVDKSTLFRSSTVSPIMGAKGLVGMKINGAYDVHFDRRSNETRQVTIGIDPMRVIDHYKGGIFHLADDRIVDYRDNKYKGFIHNETSINELSSRIGFLQTKNNSRLFARNRTAQFEHEAFARGGVFDVEIGFGWSAFSPMIDSNFEMMRALCENMMVFGRGTVMSRRIPLISDWESNMAVSNDVLKHVFQTTVADRLLVMPDERINLADMMLIKSEVLKKAEDTGATPESRLFLRNLLEKIGTIEDPELSGVLTTNDYKRIPVPISTYDAMNMATEVVTHHCGDEPSAKLQAFAVSCIFDKKRQTNLTSQEVFSTTNTFDDPDRAFWAETVH